MIDRAMVLISLITFVMAPLSALADENAGGDDEPPSPRAESVELFDAQVVVKRPTGWNIVAPGDGAVATFRAATDDQAQMEVRVSESVSEPRWERFWRTFDTDLQEAGFSKVTDGSEQSYGGRGGRFFEYEMERGGDTFRLVVWHTHEGDRAWVFTGFFRALRRDAHYLTFQEMIEDVQWPEPSPGSAVEQ